LQAAVDGYCNIWDYMVSIVCGYQYRYLEEGLVVVKRGDDLGGQWPSPYGGIK
jgi:hypothetical protein